MQYKILRQVQREGHFEVWYELLDDNGKLLAGNGIISVGKKELDQAGLDDFFKNKVIPEAQTTPPQPPDDMIPKEEVKEMLVRKGYITKSQIIDDLPDKSTLLVKETL